MAKVGFWKWLRTREKRLLRWANRRPVRRWLKLGIGGWLSTVTHMGGATFTLSSSLLCAIAAPPPWNTAGWQSLTAVVLSHVPVAVVKRTVRRLRPYQAMPDVITGRNPLIDSSFPSGHTTAVFAWLTPFLLMQDALPSALVPVALFVGLFVGLSVGWSRMYLGLHYPSDVVAGLLLGSLTGYGVSALWPST